jgi:hypothetical protein
LRILAILNFGFLIGAAPKKLIIFSTPNVSARAKVAGFGKPPIP